MGKNNHPAKKSTIQLFIPETLYFVLSGLIFSLLLQQNYTPPLLFVPVLAVFGFLLLTVAKINQFIFFKSFFLTIGVLISTSLLESLNFFSLGQGDISKAISMGAYSGLTPRANSLLWITFQVFFISSVGLIIWRGLKSSQKENVIYPTLDSKGLEKFFLSRSDRFVMFLLLVFLCSNVPSEVTGLQEPNISGGFDSQQIYTWLFFRHSGYTPMADFWSPYGGLLTFFDGTLGIFLRWATLTAIGLMLLILCNINNLKKTATYAVVFFFLMVQNFWVVEIRYLFPILALIIGIYQLNRPLIYPWWFSLPLISVWLMSPEVAIFCFAIYALAVGVNVYSKGFVLTKETSRMFLSIALNFLSLIVLIFHLLKNQQLSNLLQFVTNPSETIQYGFRPDISSTANFILFDIKDFHLKLTIALFIFVSIYCAHAFSHGHKKSQALGMIWPVLLLSEYAFFLWQKDLVRGSMANPISLLLIPLFVSLVTACDFGSKSPKMKAAKMGSLSQKHFVYIALAISAHVVVIPQNDAVDLSPPQRLHNFVDSLQSFSSSKNRNVILSRDFSKVNDINFNQINNSRMFEIMSPDAELFVLGDESAIYRHLNQKPFWTVSIWNSSPYSVQLRLIDELSNRRPEFVYLDKRPETLQFDGTPSILRTPLLYKWVAQNYSLAVTGANGDLLARNNNIGLSPSSRRYFTDVLGNEINLGFLPQAMLEPEFCGSDLASGSCADYLELVGRKGINSLTIQCNRVEYDLSYNLESTRSIWLPLERLWFYESDCKVLNLKTDTRFRAQINSLY